MFKHRARLWWAGLLIAMAIGSAAAIGIHCYRDPPLKFQLTADPQRAVFLAEIGDRVGGPGSPIYINRPPPHLSLQWNGHPIVLSAEARKRLDAHRPVSAIPGGHSAYILVDADVHLEPGSSMVSSNPPTMRNVYKVSIDQLHGAELRVAKLKPWKRK
jgi:hypothetical protein